MEKMNKDMLTLMLIYFLQNYHWDYKRSKHQPMLNEQQIIRV